MRAPFTRLYVHLVWSTWDRLPLITPLVKESVIACARAKCEELGAEAIALGAMPDHLHLLVRVPAAISVSTLVKEIKGSSSHLMTHAVDPASPFKWQGAYGAFSVSPRHVDIIRAYIQNQETHHSEGSLLTELETCHNPAGPGD